jgi:hypothetical protein
VQEAFEAIGIPLEFHPIPGAPHSAWNAAIDSQSQLALAMEFIARQQGLDLR